MHIAQNALNRYGYRLTAQEIVLLACPALPRWPTGTTEPARTAAERAKAARQAPRVTGDSGMLILKKTTGRSGDLLRHNL